MTKELEEAKECIRAMELQARSKEFSVLLRRSRERAGESVETLGRNRRRHNLVTIKRPRQILSIDELFKEDTAKDIPSIGTILERKQNIPAERNEILDLSFKKTDCTSTKPPVSEEDASDTNSTIVSLIRRKFNSKGNKPQAPILELAASKDNVDDVVKSNVELKEEMKRLQMYIEAQGEELFHLQCENANQKNRLLVLAKHSGGNENCCSKLARRNLIEEIEKLKQKKLELKQKVQSLEVANAQMSTHYRRLPGTDDLEPVRTALGLTQEYFSQPRKRKRIILFASKFRRRKPSGYEGRNVSMVRCECRCSLRL